MSEKKTVSSNFPIIVFADGASSGNPGPGGWGSVIATPEGQVTELGGGDPATTNNQMELMATIRALDRLRAVPGKVAIYTDSVYVIRGITQWVWAWRNRNWKTAEGNDVANQALWKQLIALVAQRGKENPIDWRFVKGHSGVPGNERVDAIAVAFSKGRPPRLYSGPLLGYDVAIHDIPENSEVPAPRPKQEPKPAAYSYLSLLGRTPLRHRTWPDCERRVKGQAGAKFKKAMSESDEKEILASWGFSPRDVRDG